MAKRMNLRLFINLTTNNTAGTNDMSPEMKTFYSKQLLKIAKQKLVYNQFGQKVGIPTNGGKTIEFRRFSKLAPIQPGANLSEGVVPNGLNLNTSYITATPLQYGAFVEYSDVLKMTTIDDVILQANRLLGTQAGESLDLITREALLACTNVIYGRNQRTSRALIVGGDSTWANNDYFDCELIRLGAAALRRQNVDPIDGENYVCVIHPDLAYTLKKDTEWQEAQKYTHAEKIYSGEIGIYDGVRIVQSTMGKVRYGADLGATRNLTTAATVNTTGQKTITLSAGSTPSLAGRYIILDGVTYLCDAHVAAGTTLTVTENLAGTSSQTGKTLYPGEGGKDGRNSYVAMMFGSDAYGIIDLDGLGLEHISKQLGSAGSADPLNQKATIGWKATHVAKILNDLFMVRLECTGVVNPTAAN